MLSSRSTLHDDDVLWSAVGMLLVVEYPDSGAAIDALNERAQRLGVPPRDIAAYVLWTGELPV